jgi:hypothetical protein
MGNVVVLLSYFRRVSYACRSEQANWQLLVLHHRNVAWKSTKLVYFKRKIRKCYGMGLLMGCGTFL